MFRDDAVAACIRRDELAAEHATEAAALAVDCRALRTLRRTAWRRALWLICPALALTALFVARAISAWQAADAALADTPATPVPLVDDISRCRIADGPACTRLALAATEPRRAYMLFRRACLSGDDGACLRVAELLASGVGVARSDERAAALRRDTCKSSSDPACK